MSALSLPTPSKEEPLQCPSRRLKADLVRSVIGLAALLLWEGFAGDLRIATLVAAADPGLVWRSHPLLTTGLHEGGRLLATLVLLGLLFDAFIQRRQGPSRAARGVTIGLVIVCMLLISGVKRISLTSCPWDVLDFGGAFPYVPHWPWTGSDGGPGHCFPSGHASAAFGFLPLVFLWRSHHPRRARAVLILILCTGIAFGLAQVLRGAHYVSHVVWTAWICWTVSALAMARYDGGHYRRHHGRSTVSRSEECGTT